MEPVSCTRVACALEATVKVLWPGRGWLPYCTAHGAWADRILMVLGSRTDLQPLRGSERDNGQDTTTRELLQRLADGIPWASEETP